MRDGVPIQVDLVKLPEGKDLSDASRVLEERKCFRICFRLKLWKPSRLPNGYTLRRGKFSEIHLRVWKTSLSYYALIAVNDLKREHLDVKNCIFAWWIKVRCICNSSKSLFKLKNMFAALSITFSCKQSPKQLYLRFNVFKLGQKLFIFMHD